MNELCNAYKNNHEKLFSFKIITNIRQSKHSNNIYIPNNTK